MNRRAKFSQAPRDLAGRPVDPKSPVIGTREAARDLRTLAARQRAQNVIASLAGDSQARIDRLGHAWDVIRVPKDERSAFYPQGESVGLVFKRDASGANRRLITRGSDLQAATRVLRAVKRPTDSTRSRTPGERAAARKSRIASALSTRPCLVCKLPESDTVHATGHKFLWHR